MYWSCDVQELLMTSCAETRVKLRLELIKVKSLQQIETIKVSPRCLVHIRSVYNNYSLHPRECLS